MKKWIAISTLTLAVGAGCGSDSGAGKGTYTLNLTSFEFHDGQTVKLHVKDAPGATTHVGTEASGVVANGKLTLTVSSVLEAGKSYTIDFFADLNGNQQYDPPVGATFPDHSWRRTVQGNPAGVTETFSHNDQWTDISPFN